MSTKLIATEVTEITERSNRNFILNSSVFSVTSVVNSPGVSHAAADPNRDANAKKFDHLTYMEALERRLKVMDSTALSLCMDNKLPIIVFDLTGEGNLLRLVEGDRSVGTLVS